jgi:hypothetical protein
MSPNPVKEFMHSTSHTIGHNESNMDSNIFLADNENNPLKGNHQNKTRYDSNLRNNNNEELRNTWRKAPVKINAKNLPAAFGNITKQPPKK